MATGDGEEDITYVTQPSGSKESGREGCSLKRKGREFHSWSSWLSGSVDMTDQELVTGPSRGEPIHMEFWEMKIEQKWKSSVRVDVVVL